MIYVICGNGRFFSLINCDYIGLFVYFFVYFCEFYLNFFFVLIGKWVVKLMFIKVLFF